MPRLERPLYFMAKPPVWLAEHIAAHPRTTRDRPFHLLHITLLPLVDLAELPPEFLPVLRSMMKDFEACAFRVFFDRIEERGAVTLRSSEPMVEAMTFQEHLADFLTGRDFPFFGPPPKPHVTINYRRDGKGDEAIEPISWQVEELLLVESIVGETRHETHERWPLRVSC